jgi:hypothetical protein
MRSTRIAVATAVIAVTTSLTAAPAHAGTENDVRRSLLYADEALEVTGLKGPLRPGSEGCRDTAERVGCTREWQGDATRATIPTTVSVNVYATPKLARWALQDVKDDAPPHVVRVGRRVLIAYYESSRNGTEAFGWKRVGSTVVRVGCTGPKSQRAESVTCVEDLLAAQVTRAPRS